MSNMPSPMVALPWPITSTVAASELATMLEIVSRWQERFSSQEFIEDLDNQPEIIRAQVFGQFVNELKVCASKAATLVEVFA